MKFKSRTALAEHIKELEQSGYLIPQWNLEHLPNNRTKGTRVYRINFDQVTKDGES